MRTSLKNTSKIKKATSLNIFRGVQTVPDRVIEKTRSSKFKGPSVDNDTKEARKSPKSDYTLANRDYKLINQKINSISFNI